MQTPSLVFDLFCLLIVVLTAVYFARKGLLAGLFSFLGTGLALLVAWLSSRALALPLFDRFFRPGITESLVAGLEEQSAQATDQMLASFGRFLPEGTLEGILAAAGAGGFDAQALADRIVTEVVQPVVVPIITFILFLVVFALLRMVIAMLLGFLRRMRGLPVIGTTSRALGAVAGVFIGFVYVFLLVAGLELAGQIFDPGLTGEGSYLSNSFFYGVLSRINFIH